MNNFANTQNTGLLKNFYKGGKPVSQMNESSPMMAAIRKKINALKTNQGG